MSRGRLIIIVVLVLALVGAGSGLYLYYWRQSPRYALWQMVRAIQQQDVETLFAYVDLPTVLENLADQSTADLQRWLGGSPEGNTVDDEIGRLAQNLARKFARFAVPKLTAALEPQIRAQVKNYLAELSPLERAGLSAIPPLAEINQRGEQAQVTLKETGGKRTLRLQLLWKPELGRWQIVELNYQDLKSLIQRHFSDPPGTGPPGAVSPAK